MAHHYYNAERFTVSSIRTLKQNHKKILTWKGDGVERRA